MLIRWGRSKDGFVNSKCGNWEIRPLFWGGVRPQSYELYHQKKLIGYYYETQRGAKEHAELLHAELLLVLGKV